MNCKFIIITVYQIVLIIEEEKTDLEMFNSIFVGDNKNFGFQHIYVNMHDKNNKSPPVYCPSVRRFVGLPVTNYVRSIQ